MAEVPSSVGLINIINLMREENNARNESIKQSQEGTEKNTSDLNKTMRDILEEIRQDRLQAEEDRRESKKEKSTGGFSAPMIEIPQPNWFAFIAGLGAAVAGFIKTIMDRFRAALASVALAFKNLFSKGAIGTFISRYFGANGQFAKSIRLAITNFGRAFMMGFNRSNANTLRDARNRFKALNTFEKILRKIGGFVRLIVSPFQKAAQVFRTTGVTAVAGRFGTVFTKILTFLSETFTMMTQFGANILSGAGGKLLGLLKGIFTKILWPIQVIISIFDFIGGFIRGWSETEGQNIFVRLLNATFEGIRDVVIGFFGRLLDGIGWLFGKLFDFIGLGSITDRFSQYSFSEMIDSIFSWVKKIFTDPLEALKEFFVDFPRWILGLAGDIFMGLADIVKWALKGLWNGLVWVFTEAIPAVASWLWQTVTEFGSWLGGALAAAWQGIKDGFMSFVSGIGEAWDSVVDWWENDEDKWGTMINNARALANRVKEWASGLIRSARNAWDSFVGWLDEDTDTASTRGQTNDAIDTSATPPPRPPDTRQRQRGTTRTQTGSSDTHGQTTEPPLGSPSGTPPSGDIVGLGTWLQENGLRVSGHSQFGGQEPGVHSANSRHYRDNALDVNFGHGNVEANDPQYAAYFDRLQNQLEAAGYSVMWRTGGHYDHMHVSMGAQEGTAEYRQQRLAAMQARGIPAPGSVQRPSTTPREDAGTMLAQAGNTNIQNSGNAFASFNFGGNSNTSVSNTSNMQSVIAPAFDIDAAFGPFATSAGALFGNV